MSEGSLLWVGFRVCELEDEVGEGGVEEKMSDIVVVVIVGGEVGGVVRCWGDVGGVVAGEGDLRSMACPGSSGREGESYSMNGGVWGFEGLVVRRWCL